MKSYTVLQENFMRIFSVLFVVLISATGLFAQRPVVSHDIGTGHLTISSTEFGNDYIITGTTNGNMITVHTGYQGTIKLSNVTMTASGTQSCITIRGLNNQSNLNPVTKVNIVLEGDNDIQYKGSNYCAIQVDQGAQIHISAIDPNDNASGILFANSSNYVRGTPFILDPSVPYPWPQSIYAGAGIGAPIGVVQGTATMVCPSGTACNSNTAGGNIIISSGTIFAHGGHGAGIGGGYQTYYDGLIIITGGDVQSYAQAHGAGIGSGCPCGSGVHTCFGPNSAIIVLPPAVIQAAGAANLSPYHFRYDTEYALAGMNNITYINDPNKTHITVFTQDTLPNADIYLDLTQMLDVVNIFNSLGISWDLTKVRVGRTDVTTGMFSFNAELQQATTFFTDASSINPATFGRPYMPVVRTITGTSASRDTIILPLIGMGISFTDYHSTPLELGYLPAEALTNAHCLKLSYNDPLPMSNITWTMQTGVDFAPLVFLASDSLSVISPPPTQLNDNDTIFIIFPIVQGKPIGNYSDVLLINGDYGATSLPGYIRVIGQQRVVFDDSYNNDYIRVTASPNSFTTTYPTANTVTLTLNIDHTGTNILYDPYDVVAMYLVTTIADYDLALAADPLYNSNWHSMNVPLVNNGSATTTVPFSSMPQGGVYYIHWYVESGGASAHSLDLVSPPATYGGFGPYILGAAATVTLSCSSLTVCAGSTLNLSACTPTVNLGGCTLMAPGSWTLNGVYYNPSSTVSTGQNGAVLAYIINTTSCGSFTSNTVTLTVTTPVTPAATITASGNNVCAGTSITYTVSNIANGGSSPTYRWMKGGTTIVGATGSSYSYEPENNDVITCEVTSSILCVSSNPVISNGITMVITPTVSPLINISATPG